MKCETCKFWYRDGEVRTASKCRRNPPVAFSNGGSGFPETLSTTCCGEYLAATEEELKVPVKVEVIPKVVEVPKVFSEVKESPKITVDQARRFATTRK